MIQKYDLLKLSLNPMEKKFDFVDLVFNRLL